MNHLEFLQHYERGLEDGKRQAEVDRASTALMGSVFFYFSKSIFLVIFFCPGILSAYLTLSGLQKYTGNLKSWNYGWAFVTIVYFLECLVFFLKGWCIALKKKGNGVWRIPWLTCGVYTFALPVFMLHTFIFMLFKPTSGHPTNILNAVSWIIGGLIGVYIYSRYQFQSDTAPKLMGWAYRIGKRV